MSSATATAIPPEQVQMAPLPKNPRVDADQLQKLQELKWLLSVRLRRDLTEADVLKMVLDEALPLFERRVRGTEPAQPAPSKKEKPRG